MSSSLSVFAARLRRFIRESAEASQAEARFNELALELFRLQFEHNHPYRRFCESRGVVSSRVAHWTEIPPVPTTAFKDFELTSLSSEERQRIFHSSGTTAHRPSRHFHNRESLALYEASLLPWFEKHLIPQELSSNRRQIRILSLTPTTAAAPNSSLVYMLGAIAERYSGEHAFFAGVTAVDGAWGINLEAAITFLQHAASRATPVLIAGTAFNFVHLIDHCRTEGIRFALPLRSSVLETGGYKGRSRAVPKPELHALISEFLSVPASHIVTEYGMSELSSQAYDGIVGQAKDRSFHFPPWARAQIISPETGQAADAGETGLIRIFDLANVWSVMAIQTEDLGIQRETGFELLGRAEAVEARGCSLMTSES
jgi:hypothetical protein